MKLFVVGPLLLLVTFLAISWYWLAHKVTIRGDLTKARVPFAIFDFDGTICPSYPLLIDQINFLADEYNLRKIGEDDVEKYRDMNPRSLMEALGVSTFKLPFLLRKIRKNVQAHLLELKPVPGMIEVLQELKRQGCFLGILTSNSEENVRLFLQKHGIDFFDFIYAGNNVFGKERHLNAIILKANLNPQDRIPYIGDEIRDMEAARKANLISIGVTWGYNSSKLLQQSNPDYLCEIPSQLPSIIRMFHEPLEMKQVVGEPI